VLQYSHRLTTLGVAVVEFVDVEGQRRVGSWGCVRGRNLEGGGSLALKMQNEPGQREAPRLPSTGNSPPLQIFFLTAPHQQH